MAARMALRPVDIPVAFGLVEFPNATYQILHEKLGISTSTAHDAVKRLRCAGLVSSDGHAVARLALLDFLEHGVRYAFPATLEAKARGVPTAHSGPPLASEIVSDEPVVWPSARGAAEGPSVAPLLPQAPDLVDRAPRVYAMLTLVDALRVGRARERQLAMKHLHDQFYKHAAVAA